MSSLPAELLHGACLPLPLDLLAALATPVQRIGMLRRLRGPRTRVEARVISFGNLTTGGTGKTPAVIARAEQEVAAGRRVAVITRGYGSRRVDEPFLVTSDQGDFREPLYRIIGDEPALIRLRVPEVTVVKSADRVAGARAAMAAGCDMLLLDDAFQAVALERDENILLIDATNPFGNGHLVPRGSLREPVEAAKRATEIVLTRCDLGEHADALAEFMEELCKGVPVRRTCHAPTGLWRVCDGERFPLAHLQGRAVVAASGIGHPKSFEATLKRLGAEVRETVVKRDHAPFSLESRAASDFVVVTEKDAVRLVQAAANVYALSIALQGLPQT